MLKTISLDWKNLAIFQWCVDVVMNEGWSLQQNEALRHGRWLSYIFHLIGSSETHLAIEKE